MEESAFQTLEALATLIGRRIVRLFLNPRACGSIFSSRIKISLEKPIAVPFADSPAVELLLDTHPSHYEWKEDMYDGQESNWPSPPYPLSGRLDEWIAGNTKDIVLP